MKITYHYYHQHLAEHLYLWCLLLHRQVQMSRINFESWICKIKKSIFRHLLWNQIWSCKCCHYMDISCKYREMTHCWPMFEPNMKNFQIRWCHILLQLKSKHIILEFLQNKVSLQSNTYKYNKLQNQMHRYHQCCHLWLNILLWNA